MKTSTRTLVVIFSLFCFEIIDGQQQNNLDIGILGGMNYTTIYGNNFVQKNISDAYHYAIGLSVQYHLKKVFSISGGLSYEKKGTGFDMAFFPYTNYSRYRTDLNYLVLPFMARVSYGQRIRAFIGAGGYGAYLLSVTEYVPYSVVAIPFIYKPFDFGAILSLGMSLPLKDRIAVSVEVRENIRLGKVDPNLGYTKQVGKGTTLNLLFILTYKLSIRK